MRVGPLLLWPERLEKAAGSVVASVAPPAEISMPAGQRGYDAVRTTDFAELSARLASQDMGPGVPIYPTHPEKTEPRRFDYQPGYNISYTPRSYEALNFDALRNLARSWDIAALCINRNVEDLRQLVWEIRPKAVRGMGRAAVKERRERLADVRAQVEGFWSTPDQKRSWSAWLRMLGVDLYEIDAPTIYLSMSIDDSKLYAARVVDGSTIAPLLDDRGDSPAAPQPAYRQVIRGLPWSYYMADADLPPSSRRLLYDQAHLIYDPFWPRTDSPYGQPPMEWIVLTVQRALARQVLDLSLYVNGTTSWDFWKMPKDWSATAIAALQESLDQLIAGNPRKRSELRLMPGGEGTGLEHGFIPPEVAAEEFLLHVACAAYNRSPMEMGFIRSAGGAGLGGKSVAQQQGKSANKSVRAVAFHIKAIVDRIIARHMSPELEIVFPELEDVEDILTRAEAEDIRMRNGSLGLDEARLDHDLDPIGDDAVGSTNVFYLGSNAPIRVTDVIGPKPSAPSGGAHPQVPSAEPGEASAGGHPVPRGKSAPADDEEPTEPANEELAKAHVGAWRRKALRSLARGSSPAVRFESDAIDPATQEALRRALAIPDLDAAAVRQLFEVIP